MTKQSLHSKAKQKIYQYGLLSLVAIIGTFFIGELGIILLVPAIVVFNTLSIAGISNIPCENCGSPYGVTFNPFNNLEIIVPNKCISCSTEAE